MHPAPKLSYAPQPNSAPHHRPHRFAGHALVACLLAALGGGAAASAQAAGAWTTFLRAHTFNDVIASADTVWCATEEGGLLAFDRSAGRFTTYTREPGGLASNHLTSLAYDRRGRLWIGTRDAGVAVLSPDGTWGVLNSFDGLPAPAAVNTLRAQGDTLWIGTEKGIALYNGVEIFGRLPDGVSASPFPSDDITGIVVRGDSLWVSTGAGVDYSLISSGLSSWTAVTTGLPPGSVDALASDGRDVWALAANHVWLAQPGDQWTGDPTFHFVYRLSDDFGTVLASSDSGIYMRSGGAWTQVNSTLISGVPTATRYSAAADPAGLIFAGNQGGLYEQAPAAAPWTLHDPPGPPGDNDQNVVIDGKHVYLGTFDEGIGRFDGADWTLWLPGLCTACTEQPYDALFAFSMLVDHQGYKWFGSWTQALDVMDDAGAVPFVQHLWVSSSLEDLRHTWGWSSAADSSGGRWIGLDTPQFASGNSSYDPIGIDYYSPSGLFRGNYQPGKGDSALGMANNQVRALEYDDFRHVMWVGYGGHGVQWFTLPTLLSGAPDTTGTKLTFITLADASGLDVFGVAPRGDSLWVFHTQDLRLYTGFPFLNPGVAYSVPGPPAPRGAIHPLDVALDGTVWLATANGIRVYHPGGATEDFTPLNSPLADQEVRTVRIDRATGVVWIATASGLNRFDPGYRVPAPPRLASLNVRVYPNPVPIARLLGAPLHVVGNGQHYVGRVYAIDGRLVRHLDGAGNGGLIWDGFDDHGSLVVPGLYLIRVEAGGRSATARVTLLR